jgi:Ni/Co efflux regulator RcnB
MELSRPSPVTVEYRAQETIHMMKIVFAAAAAAAVFTAAPLFTGTTQANAQSLQMAQGVDVQIGNDRDRDRDRDRERVRRDRNDGVTVGVGPNGVRVGPRRERCRTVTTTVRRDDGTRVKRTEERCG